MTSPASPSPDSRRLPASRRVPIAVAIGFTASLAVTLTVPAAASADAPLAGAIDGEVLDALATPDADAVFAALADDAYDYQGELIRVSDPAPFGPFPSDSAQNKSGDEIQSAPTMSEAFSLHTRPGAALSIFLDFDGHVTTDSLWNSSSHPTINSGPYSRESTPNNSFSEHELNGIVEVWERVAEDFAPWDVDVTTEDPGVDALSRSSSADTEYGIRVIITQDSDWYGPYGGAAYLRSFTRSYDLPAFVFSGNLAAGSPKSVAEAASHEAGHTLNLHHDALHNSDGSNTGYYLGHGDWAPIMGVGYYKDVTQWSKGEYAGANNTEDDLAIIDDYLDRLPDLSGTTTFGGSDSVTTHTLVDGGATAAHQLFVTEGPVVIDIDKVDAEGNLYADLTVRNAGGQVVASDSPNVASDWSLSATLPSGIATGTYTVEVRSIGLGSASTGFTPYASIGAYTMAIDVPADSGTTTTTTIVPATTIPGDPTPPPTTTQPSTTTGTQPPATEQPGTEPPTTEPPTAGPESSAGDRLTGISPQRLVDTRQIESEFDRLRAGDRIRLDPLAIAGIPSDASAVVINVVAVNPSATGFLSVTECSPIDDDSPTSSLNFAQGRNVGNSIIAPLSADGFICIDTSAATDVLVDVTGWTGASGSNALVGLEAQRIVDTRSESGGRLVANVPTVYSLGEALSDETQALSINVTAINPTGDGFLTIDDCSGSETTTSSLNFSAAETRGNNGIFALGTDQSLCVTSSVATHLTIDVTGEFGTGAGLTYVPASPTRLLDTRQNDRVESGASTGFDVPRLSTEGGLTIQPAAASVNLASVRHSEESFVTSWDCGDRPTTSALNTVADTPTANSALISVTTSGRSCLFHSAGGDLIVDLTGWWI